MSGAWLGREGQPSLKAKGLGWHTEWTLDWGGGGRALCSLLPRPFPSLQGPREWLPAGAPGSRATPGVPTSAQSWSHGHPCSKSRHPLSWTGSQAQRAVWGGRDPPPELAILLQSRGACEIFLTLIKASMFSPPGLLL